MSYLCVSIDGVDEGDAVEEDVVFGENRSSDVYGVG